MANVRQNALMGATIRGIMLRKLVLGACGVFFFLVFWYYFEGISWFRLTFLVLFIFSCAGVLMPVPYRLPDKRGRIESWGINGRSKSVVFSGCGDGRTGVDVLLLTYKFEKRIKYEANKLVAVEGTSKYTAGTIKHDVFYSTGDFEVLLVEGELSLLRAKFLYFLLLVVSGKDTIFSFSVVRRYVEMVEQLPGVFFFPLAVIDWSVRFSGHYFLFRSASERTTSSPTLLKGANSSEIVPNIAITSK
jgi:hypothetical protein